MQETLKKAQALATIWESLDAEEKLERLQILIGECVDLSSLQRSAIRNLLKQSGICSKKAFDEELREARERGKGSTHTGPTPVHTALAGMTPPCQQDLEIPSGWYVSGEGVFQAVEDGRKQVAHYPVIVVGRSKELNTGDEWLELAFHRNGKWEWCSAERQTVMDNHKIVGLSAQGFPVHSSNSRAMVDYVARSEHRNMSKLPTKLISNRLGWLPDGSGFLLGHDFIAAPGNTTQVQFQPLDAGDAQIARGFRTGGALDKWLEAIKPVEDYPKVLLSVYVSFAPPVLEIVEASNIINDIAAVTSTGKTIALRVCGSVWGNPDERTSDSIVHSWDLTKNWLERVSGVLHSLPLFLDDTKRCPKPQLIGQALYDVSNGRGKGRGSLTGAQSVGVWRTALISGEAPATSFRKDGGGYARTLELWGLPWKRADKTTGKLVNAIDMGVKSNYGWAGKEFVTYLVFCQGSWDDWRKDYEKIRAEYQQRAGNKAVAWRVADYFSTLILTAKLVHKALSMPWTYEHARKALDSLWDTITQEVQAADLARSALESTVSWAYAHESEFYGRREDLHQPPPGYAGRWDSGDSWDFIAFYPHKIRAVLKDLGFDDESTLRTWRDNNWLDTDGETRTTKVMRFGGGKRHRSVVIRRRAIEAVTG